MTRQAFLDLPELSSHFPLVFENSAQLITLAGHCLSPFARFEPTPMGWHAAVAFATAMAGAS